MSKFYELSAETIKTFNNIFKKKSFPVDVKFQFSGTESQKNLIKISKISDQYASIMNKDLLISINDDLMSIFDKESIEILIEQEIDKISINMDSGKRNIILGLPSRFQQAVITKYGIDKISKANQVEKLYEQQKKDGEDEFIV